MQLAGSIEFPQEKAKALFAAIERAHRELGKSLIDSLKWAGTYVCNSLRAQTKQSPKLRPIVANPDKRYKTDRRRAPFGVFRWKRDGQKYFKPIYRTGEYGSVRFFDKKSMSWYNLYRGGNKWERIPSGPDIANPELFAPGIKTDKRRIIRRSGLAKKSWSAAAAIIHNGGNAGAMDVMDVARVSLTVGELSPQVAIYNNLRYAQDALKPGAAETALENAAKKLEYQISEKIAQKMEIKA